MAGLKQFKFIPKSLAEWSKWMRDQDIEEALGDPDGDHRILESDADGVRSWVRRFDQWPAQYRGSSNQSLGVSNVVVDLVTEDYNPSAHYAVSNDVVQADTSGWYKVTYEVYASVDTTGGTTQCNLLTYLMEDDKTTIIPGSYAASYLHETGLPDASAGTSCIVFIGAGAGVCIGASISAATDVSTVANRCKLIIERVR